MSLLFFPCVFYLRVDISKDKILFYITEGDMQRLVFGYIAAITRLFCFWIWTLLARRRFLGTVSALKSSHRT